MFISAFYLIAFKPGGLLYTLLYFFCSYVPFFECLCSMLWTLGGTGRKELLLYKVELYLSCYSSDSLLNQWWLLRVVITSHLKRSRIATRCELPVICLDKAIWVISHVWNAEERQGMPRNSQHKKGLECSEPLYCTLAKATELFALQRSTKLYHNPAPHFRIHHTFTTTENHNMADRWHAMY